MSTKLILLGSICAVVLGVAGPALADGFSGVLSADYNKIDLKNGGGFLGSSGHDSGDVWGLNGQASTALGDSGASAQIDGGWHRATASGDSAALWNGNGSIFGMVNKGGRIGATYGYEEVNAHGLRARVGNYGLFAEWWASDVLTVGGKIGGFDGHVNDGGMKFGNDGYYGSGLVRYYYMPDLGLSASIDHTHGNGGGDVTAYTLGGEYLISETMPISVGAGGAFTDAAGLHANTYFLTLNYYCNGDNGAESLRDRQRAGGSLGWDTGFGSIFSKF